MRSPREAPRSLDEALDMARDYWKWGTEPMSQLLLTLLVQEVERQGENPLGEMLRGDELRRQRDRARAERDDARERLAAVEALCDKAERRDATSLNVMSMRAHQEQVYGTSSEPWPSNVSSVKIRAALTTTPTPPKEQA